LVGYKKRSEGQNIFSLPETAVNDRGEPEEEK
jgi:hypothetical protein